MIDLKELEVRLVGWAEEYGGSRYEHVGWHSRNLLQTLVEHRGFVPSSGGYIPVPVRSAADEIESLVRDLEASDMQRHGAVLRCDYFLPHCTIEERLRRMGRDGFTMSRAGYYDILAQAKTFLRGALRKKIAA